jgi:hypothetical protein
MGGTGGGPGTPTGIAMPTTPAGSFTGAKDPGKDERRRYEFVVMFIWREPVPKIEPNPDAPLAAPATGSPLGGEPSSR